VQFEITKTRLGAKRHSTSPIALIHACSAGVSSDDARWRRCAASRQNPHAMGTPFIQITFVKELSPRRPGPSNHEPSSAHSPGTATGHTASLSSLQRSIPQLVEAMRLAAERHTSSVDRPAPHRSESLTISGSDSAELGVSVCPALVQALEKPPTVWPQDSAGDLGMRTIVSRHSRRRAGPRTCSRGSSSTYVTD